MSTDPGSPFVGAIAAAGIPATVPEVSDPDAAVDATRQVHVLEVEGDRILGDRAWCGGRRPAGLPAEMQAAADAG